MMVGRWASRLCWVAAFALASSWGHGEAGQQSEEGMMNCHKVFNVEVYTGGNKALTLPLTASSPGELVTKYDPETKNWVEQILHTRGTSTDLNGKIASISLLNTNFTVWNAGSTEDGLYRVIDLLGNSCLAAINVTVLDLPFPEAAMPIPGISSRATSRPTEKTEAYPPGKNGAVRCCSTSVLVVIILISLVIVSLVIVCF